MNITNNSNADPVIRRSNDRKCTGAHGYEHLIVIVWPWIDACVYSVAPFITLVIFNVLITRQVYAARRHDTVPKSKRPARHSSMTTSANCNTADNIISNPGARTSAVLTSSTSHRLLVSATGVSTSGGCLTESNAVQLRVILATITVTFLVTTLPMTVVMIVKAYFESVSSPEGSLSSSTYNDESFRRGTARLILAQTVCELLMYANHSINFFLYCAAGEKFRRELVSLGRRIRRRCRPSAVTGRSHEMASTGGLDNQSNVVMLAVITTDK